MIVYCINIKQTLSSAKMIILLVTKIQKVSKLATHHSFMNANITHFRLCDNVLKSNFLFTLAQ